MKIYKIDSSRLIKIREEGYQKGQEQAKIFFDDIPENESFSVEVVNKNIKKWLIEKLNINADVDNDILLSIDNTDSQHIAITVYYISSKSRICQHYTVSYKNTDKNSCYETANEIIEFLKNNKR